MIECTYCGKTANSQHTYWCPAAALRTKLAEAQQPDAPLTVAQIERIRWKWATDRAVSDASFNALCDLALEALEASDKIERFYRCPNCECFFDRDGVIHSPKHPALTAQEPAEITPYLGEPYSYCDVCGRRIYDGEGHADVCIKTPAPTGEAEGLALAKELIHIANSDYAECDPTTGEAYEKYGREIVSAAALIKEQIAALQERDETIARLQELAEGRYAHLEDTYKKLDAKRTETRDLRSKLAEAVKALNEITLNNGTWGAIARAALAAIGGESHDP